jgi:5'-AMP-activated protein kinase catalytic alpha subunit
MIQESTELGVLIEVPRQFGRYTYVRTIGAAASSVVLLVVDQTGQQYAAKVVKREFLIIDSNLEYFEREVRLLQFINHPNIVQFHEIVYQTDNIIVIMEFCEQGDLFLELAKSGALPIRRVRSYTYQLLKALQCLHEKGFAHRDLKPENILVFSESIIKVADLGLARAAPADGMMTTICGSVHYMAPEILQELPYDGMKADMWSFGIIVFAMCLNQLPWVSRDNAALVREIIKGVVVCPPHMLAEIAQIVQWCTKRNPKERPTPGALLDLPWFGEEVVGYNRTFGLNGKLSVGSIRDSASFSVPRMVGASISKSTAKIILGRSTLLRNAPSLDAKALRAANPFG